MQATIMRGLPQSGRIARGITHQTIGANCVLSFTGKQGGSSTLVDYSVQGNNGTIVGATWKRLPSGLWYLDFDGEDDFIATSESIGSLTAWTIETWFYCSDVTGDRCIYSESKTDAATQVILVRLNTTTGVVFARVRDDVGDTWFNTGTTNVADSIWHLIHVVRDGNDFAVYYDGSPTAEISGTQADVGTSTFDKWTWGAEYQGIATPRSDFKGKMVLQRIYTSALSAAVRAKNYNQEGYFFGV